MTGPNDLPSPDEERPCDEDLISALWSYDELISARLSVGDSVHLLVNKDRLAQDTLSRLEADQATIRLLTSAAASLSALTVESLIAGAQPLSLESNSDTGAVFRALSDLDLQGVSPSELPKSFGRFKLVRELGRGGLGVVLLAHDPILHRDVALKIPRPEALLTPGLRARFLREAQAAARLTHPNVVTVYEVGHVGAVTYIAAAYCPGMNLAEWLHSLPDRVAPRQAAQIVAQLADGIGYAHRQGVLHRDLKPSNVLLETSKPSPSSAVLTGEVDLQPKVSDFGLARIQDTSGCDTRAGLVMGTPNYMAPEQANGSSRDISKETDVYGLGAILYELLTNRPPFRGASDAETLVQVVGAEPTRPRAIRPDLSPDLEAICLKCLEKRPIARYASADDLAADLRCYLAGEPTLARPLSSLRRIAKWSKRRPALAGLIVTSVLFALSIAGGSILYSLKLSETLAESEQRRIAAETNGRESERQRELAEQSRQEMTRQRDANAELVYGARMHQGYQSLAKGYVKQVEALLANYDDGSPSANLRGFEWHYLKQSLRGERLILRGHEGEVYGVAYSPDGHVLASAAEDGKIKLWDPVSGSELRTIGAHTACVNDLAFSPDGRLLASASCDHTVKIWDTTIWRLLSTIECGPKSIMTCLEFSPDGWRLAAGDNDSGELTVWDVASFAQLVKIDTDGLQPMGGFDALKWSPDGSRLATSCVHKNAQIWDTESWREVATWVPYTRSLVYSPDSRRIITHGNEGKGIRIRDMQTGDDRLFPSGILGPAYKVVVSPDGTRLYVTDDQVVRIWALGEDGYPSQILPERILMGHQGRVQSFALAPNGQTAATASFDGTVRLWDLAAARDEVPVLRTESRATYLGRDLDRVTALVEGSRLVTYDISQEVPSVLAERPVSRIQDNHHCGFSPDGQFLFAWSAQDVRFGRVDDGPGGIECQTVSGVCGVLGPPTFSRDCRVAAINGKDGIVHAWDTQTEAEVYAAKQPFSQDAIQIGQHGVRLAISGNDCTLAIVDGTNEFVQLGTPIRLKVDRGVANGQACYTQFSPDGRLLAIAQFDGVLHILDRSSGRSIRAMRTSSFVRAIAFTPDGRTMATGLHDGRIVRWHVPTGQELGTFVTRNGWVEELRFSSDGRALGAVIVENPQTYLSAIYIWECRPRASRRQISAFKATSQPIFARSNLARDIRECD